MYDDILVPTDGSDGTERTLEHAVEIARNHGARLHALSVVDRRVYLEAAGRRRRRDHDRDPRRDAAQGDPCVRRGRRRRPDRDRHPRPNRARSPGEPRQRHRTGRRGRRSDGAGRLDRRV